MTTHHSPITNRRGVALIGAVVVLAILSVMMTAIAWQMLANRRMLEHRQYALQAVWLARAGVERAAARLLTDSAAYEGEVGELIPDSAVRIKIEADSSSADIFWVTSEARYPTDADDFVVRSVTRRFRRQTDGGTVRREVVPEKRPPSGS